MKKKRGCEVCCYIMRAVILQLLEVLFFMKVMVPYSKSGKRAANFLGCGG
jgi:hypothetical protein